MCSVGCATLLTFFVLKLKVRNFLCLCACVRQLFIRITLLPEKIYQINVKSENVIELRFLISLRLFSRCMKIDDEISKTKVGNTTNSLSSRINTKIYIIKRWKDCTDFFIVICEIKIFSELEGFIHAVFFA